MNRLLVHILLLVPGFVLAQQWKNLGPCGSDTYGNHVASQGGTGQIHCITFDPDSPDTVYCGSPFAGLWKSVDGGRNWSNKEIDIGQNLEFASVSDVAITGRGNKKRIWITTGHEASNGYAYPTFLPYSSGIFISDNGGKSFSPLNSFNQKFGFIFKKEKHITRIVAHPTNPDILFVATSDGLYRTVNGGKNWQLVFKEKGNTGSPMNLGVFSVEFSKTDPDHTIYVGSQDIYRSIKEGSKGSFRSITINRKDLQLNDPECFKYVRFNLELNQQAQKDVIYASSFIVGDTCGPYKNSQAYALFYFDGRVWTKKSTPPASFVDAIRLRLASVPNQPNIIYAGSGIACVSSDYGGTWSEALNYNQPGHADIHALRNIPGTNDLLAGTDGGVFRYTYSTKKVDEYNNGLCLGQIFDMSTSPTDPDRILIGLQDVGSDMWDGKQWTKLPMGGDGYKGQLIDYSNNRNFFSCFNLQFYKNSSEKGINLKRCDACNSPAGRCPFSFKQDPVKPNIYYFGTTEIFKSVDTAKTWCRISDFKNEDGFYLNSGGHIIYDMAIAPSNTNIVYACFNAAPTCCNTALFKTTTGGTECSGKCGAPNGKDEWTMLNIPRVETGDQHQDFLANGYHFISSIAVSDKDPNKLWIGFCYYDLKDPFFKLFASDDGGKTWQKDEAGLPDYPLSKLVYINGSDDALFAAAWNGVYYKEKGGLWKKYGEGLPHIFVSNMEINYPSHKLRVSTFGGGVWEIDLP